MPTNNLNLLLHRTFQYLGIVLVMAAMGGGYWYWKQAKAAQTVNDNRPSFEAPLTHDLNLSAGQGIATYSRADGADRRATVTDFEGRIIPVKQNEARFEGARRVENLASHSENFSDASWSKSNVTVTSAAAVAPDGTLTAWSVSPTGVSNSYINKGSVIFSGVTYTRSVYAKAGNGSQIIFEEFSSGIAPIYFDLSSGVVSGGAGAISKAITSVGGGWYLCQATFTPIANSSMVTYVDAYGTGGAGDNVYLWHPQLEDVSGQSDKAAAEYISTNVKTSSPYHGAGVDGVKYFNTERSGATIVSSTLKGYLAEGARTNLVLQSDNIGTTWSKENLILTSYTDVTASPDGRSTADKMIEDTSNAQHRIYQYVTHTASTSITGSAYVKAAGRNHASVFLYNVTNSVVAGAVIDLTNGTLSNTVGTVSAVSAGNGWYRVQATGTPTVTSTGLHIYTANGTGSVTPSYAGDGTSGVYVWGAQLEQAAFASSYIPTTTATVVRAADSLSYPLASNVNDSEGSIAIDVTTEWSGGTGWDAYFYDSSLDQQRFAMWHWSGSNNLIVVDRDGNGGVRNNYDSNVIPITKGTAMKLGQRWNDSAHSLFRDGVLRGSDTSLSLPYDVISSGNLFVGRSYSSGSQYAFAGIKNVRIWKKALSDTELQSLTSTTEGIATSAVKKTTVTGAPDNTGLVGYWSFEDGSGTKAEDFSPTGINTGTLTNGPTWVDGKIGKALNFDGTNDYVGVGISEIGPNIGSVNAITLSSWVKPTVYPGALGRKRAISFLLSDGTTGGLLGFYDGGKIEVGGRSTGGDGFQSATVTFPALDEWHLATGVLDFQDDKIYVYLDGVLSATQSVSFANTTYTHGTPTLIDSLGSFSNSSDFFSGSLDEVRIYNYALSASEIAGLYAQGSTGKTTVNASQNNDLTNGLIGLWSFNGPDLSGTTAYDRSGQGNNGTLTNGPAVYPGKVGQGLKFDGVNDFVSFGSNLSSLVTTELTVSAWVRPTLVPDGIGRVVVTTYDWDAVSANIRGWLLGESYGSDTKLSFFVYDSIGASASASHAGFFAEYLTQWTHVVGVFKGGQYLRLYVNDSMSGEDVTSVPASIGYNPAINLRIGARAESSTQGDWHGQIDEVRIYDRALSVAEISALYQMGK